MGVKVKSEGQFVRRRLVDQGKCSAGGRGYATPEHRAASRIAPGHRPPARGSPHRRAGKGRMSSTECIVDGLRDPVGSRAVSEIRPSCSGTQTTGGDRPPAVAVGLIAAASLQSRGSDRGDAPEPSQQGELRGPVGCSRRSARLNRRGERPLRVRQVRVCGRS
jgi:hypothetical protein